MTTPVNLSTALPKASTAQDPSRGGTGFSAVFEFWSGAYRDSSGAQSPVEGGAIVVVAADSGSSSAGGRGTVAGGMSAAGNRGAADSGSSAGGPGTAAGRGADRAKTDFQH